MGRSNIRPPAVAGLFYPNEIEVLDTMLGGLLKLAIESHPARSRPPKALLVPHAGYIYSGATAARGYAALAPFSDQIRRVVILGPCHRVAVSGIALPTSDAFRTPLGTIAVDREALETVRSLPGVSFHDSAHTHEHSLEVQLPFLQALLLDFTVLPLAVGHADPRTVSAVIEALWGGPETLFVVSSDLSHYHSYEDATALDGETVRRVLALQPEIHPEQACGAYPLNGLLALAQQHHLAPRLIDLCNSGDTAGDRSRVVGYCAIAFDEDVERVLH